VIQVNIRSHIALASLGVLVWPLPRPASAVDAFEIQVYDGTANERGVPGLELHVNAVPSGRSESVGPELPSNHQSHFTLEPSLGLLRWWEVGGYLQTALRGDGTYEYAGTKLRSKFVTPPSFSDRVRLGVNFEAAYVPEHYDRNRWSMEVRPIAAYEDTHWLFAINPIVDVALAGSDSRQGPSFQPAAMAVLKILGAASLGVECYGDCGPLSGFLPWREQEHYLFEVLNLLAVSDVEFNAGIGEGLTTASNSLTVKVIVGYSWQK
jgi:hypothetical protein